MAVGERIAEPCEELDDLVREVVDHQVLPVPLQGDGTELATAGRPPDAEVDPAWIERLEDAELLGHLERAVVRQHHAARADADRRRARRQVRDEDLGSASGEPGRRMVLRHPVAAVAEPLGELNQLHAVREGGAGVAARGDRALVEDREGDGHAAGLTPRGASPVRR